MTTKAQEFCNWLGGYFELSTNETLNKKQVETIKTKLMAVFDDEHILPAVETAAEPVQ